MMNIDLDAWEKSREFISARTTFYNNQNNSSSENPNTPVDDAQDLPLNSVLSTLLNSQNIIRVNPWFFKLDPNTRKVYALNTSLVSKLPLLYTNRPSDSDILVFSFDDNVFELLEGNNSSRSMGCTEQCQKAKTSAASTGMVLYCPTNLGIGTSNSGVGSRFRLLRTKYECTGIMNSLYIRFQNKTQTIANNSNALKWEKVMADVSWEGSWQRPCEFSKITSHSIFINAARTAFNPGFGVNTSDRDWNVYCGYRCLANFSLTAQIHHFNLCGRQIETIGMGTLVP